MEFLVIIAVVLAFEYAVARWAHDSRDGFSVSKRPPRPKLLI